MKLFRGLGGKKEGELTRKQKVQAKIRRIQTLPWHVAAVLALVLILLACMSQFLVPKTYSYEETGGNENKITLDFVGDVMLDRGVKKLGKVSGREKVFSNMTDWWGHADLVFANLESAVLKSDASDYEETQKAIHLWTDYAGLESARRAGVNVFSCANNHMFDYGEKAVLELLDYFRKEEITYSGIGESLEDASVYRMIECNGVKIAFLAITDVFLGDFAATESNGGVLTTAYTDYNMKVYQAAQEADLTIVYFHWGKENGTSVSDEQISRGHQLIDAGADIVIGSHPHVVQEVELYEDGIIFYSLGNFIFDQGNTYARDSVMVEYTAYDGGIGEFRLYPVRINDAIPSVTTNWFYKARINRELSQGLAKDSYYLDENGFIVIPFDISIDTSLDSSISD